MTRPISPDRFRALIETAIQQFVADGYQRTQIADIAAAMGVAKGTVYLYVESKEALFDLAVRHADETLLISLPDALPVPTPSPGSTLAFVRQALAQRAVFPRLTAALAHGEPSNLAEELRGIAEEVYDVLFRHRQGLKLIDRCAADYPELAELWFSNGRGGLFGLFQAYLQRRATMLRPIPDVPVAARLMLELLVLWAVHRHFDPQPQPMDESPARAEAVEWVCRSLMRLS